MQRGRFPVTAVSLFQQKLYGTKTERKNIKNGQKNVKFFVSVGSPGLGSSGLLVLVIVSVCSFYLRSIATPLTVLPWNLRHGCYLGGEGHVKNGLVLTLHSHPFPRTTLHPCLHEERPGQSQEPGSGNFHGSCRGCPFLKRRTYGLA